MSKEFLVPCNICANWCLSGRPCYDIITSGIPRTWEELRLAWIKDLLRMGKLTDHSQSMCGDEKWDYITVPHYKKLNDAYSKYQKFASNLDLPHPHWYERACEEMESEGGSPDIMKTDVLEVLQMTNVENNLYGSLRSYWQPAPQVWPTIEYLTEQIKNMPEYKDYCFWRENNPKQALINGIDSNETMMDRCISMITGTIFGNWCNSFLKQEILDGEIIQTSYNKATLNGNVTRGKVEYCQPDRILSHYFLQLENKYVEKLYMKGGVYDYKQLDEMIPYSTCSLFCRERIMLRFMIKLEALKPRGYEWKATMLSLEESIPKKDSSFA